MRGRVGGEGVWVLGGREGGALGAWGGGGLGPWGEGGLTSWGDGIWLPGGSGLGAGAPRCCMSSSPCEAIPQRAVQDRLWAAQPPCGGKPALPRTPPPAWIGFHAGSSSLSSFRALGPGLTRQGPSTALSCWARALNLQSSLVRCFTVIISDLQRRPEKAREVKQLAQGHTAGKEGAEVRIGEDSVPRRGLGPLHSAAGVRCALLLLPGQPPTLPAAWSPRGHATTCNFITYLYRALQSAPWPLPPRAGTWSEGSGQ